MELTRPYCYRSVEGQTAVVYHTERKEACATTAAHIVMERGKEERFFKTQNMMTIFL